MKTMFCVSAVVALAGVANANTVTTFADQDQFGNGGPTLGSGFVATVQSGGIRGGDSGARFWNIQGNDDDFASWGAVRFDLTELYAFLDAEAVNAGFNPGDWVINSVGFQAEQSNAFFSANGGPIEVYHVPDDATGINPRTDAGDLAGFGNVLGGNRMYNGSLGAPSGLLGQFNYSEGANGTVEGTDISGVLGLGELDGSDAFLTLIFDTNDLGVQATYKGQESPFNGINAPALVVDFDIIPAPGAVALAGFAGLAAARRRRA